MIEKTPLKKITQIDENDFREKFGSIMRLKRKNSSYTIDELIERSKYSFTNGALSKMERGCNSISLYRALVLCEALDTDILTILKEMQLSTVSKSSPALEAYSILAGTDIDTQKKYLEILKILTSL